MKQVLFSMLILLGCIGMTFGQKTVTGKVTDNTGEAVIGANVIVKEAPGVGTISDIDGMYSVTIPKGGITLVFSYTGFETKSIEIGNSSTINIVMNEGKLLEEVVVTALGIKRSEKSLGYSVQAIGGSDLFKTQSTNLVDNLAGNIAGVQVISGAGSSLGGSAKIRIRGVNGLSSGDPLFVVDGTPISNANFSGTAAGSDFGNLAADINPEDVETISVLKGPSASALYGNRAKNGVVLITMKKGSKSKKGFGITASTSLTVDNVYVLPSYQNEYGGGYDQDFIPVVDPVDGKTYNTLDYSADESWGPKMDGTLYRPWSSWFPGESYGKTQPLSPNPNNVRDFFDTGVLNQNSFSVGGGGDVSSIRLSFANVAQTGVFPNSKFSQNTIGISGSYDLSKKIKFFANMNILSNSGRARPEFGYNGKNPANSFNQWFQRQLDMDVLRNYLNEDGTMKSWNIKSSEDIRPLYWDNPFYIQYNSYNTDSRSRYYGNTGLTYAITDHLNVKATVNRDDYTQRIQFRNGSQSLDESFYGENVINGREDNYEMLFTYMNKFGNFTFDGNLGGNQRVNTIRTNNASTVGGLNTPDLFTLAASVDRPDLTSALSEKKVNSVFGAANFGYRDFLYLGATIRNDWSSALPKNNNSYLYPSVTGSFVFSELLNNSFLSFGKLRASWAQVGSDLDAYSIGQTYVSGTPYGSTPAFNESNVIIDPNLKPALSTSYEIGADLRFFQDRLGIDATFYNQDSKDEILAISIPNGTGYTSALINAGLFRSTGYEVTLSFKPVVSQSFNWSSSFNFAHNTSKVIELYQDLTNYKLADGIGAARWGGLSVNAEVGKEWGVLTGGGYTYDANGIPKISASGAYVRTPGKELGSILPDFTGGFRNSLSFNNFDFSAMIDFQVGGKFFSTSKMFNAYSGLGIETVGNNDKGKPIRDAVADGGGIKVTGAVADGSIKDIYVAPDTYFGRFFGFHERWVYDASYVKLRELSLGYTFPKTAFGGHFSKLRIAAIARNPLLIYTAVEGIDPSQILPGSNNIIFEERGGLPGTRSFGLKLDIGL
ncbi:MAG: SusC/RagA family TonB-linked outer membrane protein [Saprospiraceae bacterium]|nr:SusC/RagA family TonB-linked outer membrane protein [Saprospiraceae bacterium]